MIILQQSAHTHAPIHTQATHRKSQQFKPKDKELLFPDGLEERSERQMKQYVLRALENSAFYFLSFITQIKRDGRMLLESTIYQWCAVCIV